VSPIGAPLVVMNNVGYLFMSSATVYAYATTQVVVTLSDVIASGTPTFGDFGVSVAGSAWAATAVQVTGTKLTLTGPSISAGNAVTVSYTKSAASNQNVASTVGSMDTQASPYWTRACSMVHYIMVKSS
jgi:hypothetical protein